MVVTSPSGPVDVQEFRLEHPSCETMIEGMDLEDSVVNVLMCQRGLGQMPVRLAEAEHRIIFFPSRRQKRIIARHVFRMIPSAHEATRQLGIPGDWTLTRTLEFFKVTPITATPC